jgi:hypothetical protein
MTIVRSPYRTGSPWATLGGSAWPAVDTLSAASVAHILDHRRRARGLPPPVELVLPDDPRVRDLRVTPHALSAYDTLLTPPADEEATDGPTG